LQNTASAQQAEAMQTEMKRLYAVHEKTYEQLLNTQSILLAIRQHTVRHLTDEVFEQATLAMSALFPNYSARLKTDLHCLTKREHYLFLLLKLNLPTTVMADLLGIDRASVSRVRLRIKEKIETAIGIRFTPSSYEFEMWVRNF
jgi:DNA-binding CsgD family transcriptional regulator